MLPQVLHVRRNIHTFICSYIHTYMHTFIHTHLFAMINPVFSGIWIFSAELSSGSSRPITCESLYVCIYIRKYVCIYLYMRASLSMDFVYMWSSWPDTGQSLYASCMYAYVYVCIYIYMCIHVSLYVCMYVYVCACDSLLPN
jgi:hypothetical protein